ncbi:LysR family transcriptional regulator [Actinomadura alba]|uniref:LysR family transcriptional regulator n=1 Tax=Actinomadura alba TaxID=406431 RepID=A0ABR7LV77_9ACTN|nr:LysR family transcriptional regulator [Actinomadura alba]MBC6468751.1 LysR family transcriptional regulator [Actinomadura alba]
MDVHVRDLRYFLAVAEELHFTRAAERLFVSQPALSKQIGRLEATLRVPLFVRDRRSVALTAAGSALVSPARDVVARWDEAQRAVADAAAAETAVLRVGMSTSVGRDLLPSAAERFAMRHPSWRIQPRQVDWGDPTAGLADGTADVALIWLPASAEPPLTSRVLVTEPRWVALPAAHRLAGNEEIAFAELLDEPFLALPQDAGAVRDHWLAMDQRAGHPVRIGATVANADETFEAITNGLGIALLSSGNAAIYRRPGIVTRPVTGLSPTLLSIAWRAGDHRAVVRDFVEACTAYRPGEGREETAP